MVRTLGDLASILSCLLCKYDHCTFQRRLPFLFSPPALRQVMMAVSNLDQIHICFMGSTYPRAYE